MKKAIASICTIGGLIALIYTAINYMNNTESFGFMGADFVVSRGDPIPMIISAFVMIVGIILFATKDK